MYFYSMHCLTSSRLLLSLFQAVGQIRLPIVCLPSGESAAQINNFFTAAAQQHHHRFVG